MSEPKPRVKLPKSVTPGVPFTVKARITHPMHTGLRHDRDDNLVPRQIINRFAVKFNGEEALSVDLEPAISTDPYFQFEMVVSEAGVLDLEWVDDDGSVYRLSKQLAIA